MDRPTSRPRAAWWIQTVSLVLLLALGTVILIGIWPPPPDPSWGFTGFQGLLGAAIGSMGAVVTYRRPTSRVGWVLLAAGLITGVQYVVDLLPQVAVHEGVAGTPVETWTSWISNIGWVPSVTLIGYLLLIYPDGRPPGPFWSLMARMLAVAAVAAGLVAALTPGGLYNYPEIQNPTGVAGLPRDVLLNVAYPIYMACLGGTALSLVARWRRAQTLVRAQLKWLALAGIPFVIATSLSVVSREAQYVAIGFGALIPAAIAMAILRDRLFEIDRIISRSITWAIVTAALALAFVGLVLVLQAALSGITQGQTLAVAASTLAAFALFQPLRRRVQEVVDRRFDRSRYDAEQMVEGFAGRLRSEVDLPAVRQNLLATAAHAVHPLAVGVWMRAVEGNRTDGTSSGLDVPARQRPPDRRRLGVVQGAPQVGDQVAG